MKKPTSKTPLSSSSQIIQTAVWAEKNGFKCVPLHPRSKAAINRDYVSATYSSPQPDYWKSNNLGIGLVTGPLHSGPVDTDLDCPEALFFAPFFLPPTQAVFGRASKPRSHYLYNMDCNSFEKFALLDPVSKQCIIEARGDGGHQTVMPGSLHEETGEEVKWDSVPFPEVLTINSEEYAKAIRKIAISTLLVRYAWGAGTHNETTKNLAGILFYLEWPLEDTELLIQALMEYDNDKDRSRIPTVRATYKRGEAGKKIAGAGVFRKQLNNDAVVDKILEWAGNSTVNLLQEYNDRYACVMLGNKFRIADFNVPPSCQPQFYGKDDWLEYTSTDKMDVEDADGKIKKIPKSRVWLASERRRKYDKVDFMPGDDDSHNTLNLWTGWAVQPHPTALCTAYLELIKDVICGGDDTLNTWTLHWLANIVREPMNRLNTALVLIGKEGAGKSFSMRYFGKILGKTYTTISNPKHLHGQFNKHLSTTLLLNSEEALYGGDKQHAGQIRDLITGETMQMEPKGVDSTTVHNFMRVALLSNSELAAPVALGDRRYTVINMKDRKVSPDLVKRLLKEEKGDGPAALFYFLNTMPYDPDLARTNIKNDSLIDIKTYNLSPVDAWWYDTLSSSQLLPDKLSWAQIGSDSWPQIVATPALCAAMQVHLRNIGIRYIPNSTSFGIHLNKMIGVTLFKTQKNFDNILVGELGIPQAWTMLGSRMACSTNFPALEACRKAFESYVGQKLEWPEEGDEVKVPEFMKEKKPHEKY